MEKLKQLKKERQIKKAEKIMGIRLYDWQREYIKEGSSSRIPQGRRTGRTTAHMLRQLLEDNAPIEVRLPNLRMITDEEHGREYERIYFHDFLKLREMLVAGGMKIREIKVIRH